MKTHLSLLIALLFCCLGDSATAQTVVSTASAFSNNNGTGTVTFNLQNTTTIPLVLKEIKGVLSSTSSVPVEIWYNPTPVNGTPGPITPANGWVRIDSTNVTGAGNSTTTTLQTFFSNINFQMPAGTTYGFAVYGNSQRYYTMSAAATFSNGGLSILTGPNISYGGGTINTSSAPTNTPRGWIGSISFDSAATCSTPPTAGTTVSATTSVCATAPTIIGLSGNSYGATQTYQLQSSSTLAGTYTNIGSSQLSETFTINPTATKYYRIAVTCGTSTVYSTPLQLLVNGGLAGGTYTINSGAATGGTNFHSFGDAVNAFACGVTGPVVLNVVPSSGPYNEQVVIPELLGTSATNTVTINGNHETLTFNSTSSSDRVGILLNGADHIIIKDHYCPIKHF